MMGIFFFCVILVLLTGVLEYGVLGTDGINW